MQDSSDPLGVRQLLKQLLGDETVGTERNCQHKLAVQTFLALVLWLILSFFSLFLHDLFVRLFFRLLSLFFLRFFVGFATSSLPLLLVARDDVVADLAILEGTDDCEDVFVACQSSKGAFELLGAAG